MTKDECDIEMSKAIMKMRSHIAELKKENAELKKRNGELAGQKASLERWFGEAKEIIKKYYNYNSSSEYYYEDVDNEAEQFLKESK